MCSNLLEAIPKSARPYRFLKLAQPHCGQRVVWVEPQGFSVLVGRCAVVPLQRPHVAEPKMGFDLAGVKDQCLLKFNGCLIHLSHSLQQDPQAKMALNKLWIDKKGLPIGVSCLLGSVRAGQVCPEVVIDCFVWIQPDSDSIRTDGARNVTSTEPIIAVVGV